jgi:hypothetical protein
MNSRWEIAEFEHHPHDWSQARRCIVARRRMEEADPQPTLFTLDRYAYRAWHTNPPLTPTGVWHWYDGRAGMEPRIREIREDYCVAEDSHACFCGQRSLSGSRSLGLQLGHSFSADLSSQRMASLTLSKLRHIFFWLPGELTRPQNRPIVRFATWPLIQKGAHEILHHVHGLKPLGG